ncbi:MAG: DinB family protein [Planctomycetes bacterium]|nr:DinB family protein [Planctomycetota bacterium]
MNRQPWFERRFEFGLAPENRHDVVARLMATPLQLHAFCRDLPPARATAREGRQWSIQENVGHLLDLEPLWAARTEDLTAGAAVLTPADLENRKTHTADHNRAALADLVAEFAQQRGAWIDRLHGLGAADFARSARHPRLDQPMRLVDHCVFVAEHDAHHLGRILQLLGT